MKFLVVLIALIGAVVASDVIECTDDNFADVVGPMDIALVEFFAPWCGHCKKLAPEYETAATKLKHEDEPVPLVKVDCTANQGICTKHGVSGYPTLKIFRNGEVAEDYNGPRQADGIVTTMKSKAGPTVRFINTIEELNKKIVNRASISPILLCLTESEMPATYRKSADGSTYSFFFANNTDIIEAIDGKADTIMLMRHSKLKNKFEDSTVVMENAKQASKDKIDTFVNDNAHGKCGIATSDNVDRFSKKPIIRAFYKLDYDKDAKGTNYWRNRILKVNQEHKLGCAVSNFEDTRFNSELSNYGVSEELDDAGTPQVVIFDDKGRKYPMKSEPKGGKEFMAHLETFIKAFEAGGLVAHVKSEDLPEDNDGPVKVVVGKNFDEIVMDKSKDVLIEFYAPWCGHCKSLAPKFDELGEKIASEGPENVVIAKTDATANDYPDDFKVSGFPTLYWVTKDNEVRKYSGGREVTDFVKYIKENVSKSKKPDEL